jgi:hypothetical protein
MVGSPAGASALDLSFLEWSTYAFPVFLLTFPVMVLLFDFITLNLRIKEVL